MTKSDYVDGVNGMLETFAPILTKCDVNIEAYKQEYAARTVPQLKEGFKWLEARAELIANYRKIRMLLSEEIWDRYKHMDTEDFREVILLNEAIAKIRKSFVGRPALFRKVKDASKCKTSGAAKS